MSRKNEGYDEYDACGWLEGVLDVEIRYAWAARRIVGKQHKESTVTGKADYLMKHRER